MSESIRKARLIVVGDRVTLAVDRDVPADDRPQFVVVRVVRRYASTTAVPEPPVEYTVRGGVRTGYAEIEVQGWEIDAVNPGVRATVLPDTDRGGAVPTVSDELERVGTII